MSKLPQMRWNLHPLFSRTSLTREDVPARCYHFCERPAGRKIACRRRRAWGAVSLARPNAPSASTKQQSPLVSSSHLTPSSVLETARLAVPSGGLPSHPCQSAAPACGRPFILAAKQNHPAHPGAAIYLASGCRCAHLHLDVDADGAGVASARLHHAAVVDLEVVAHHDVLEVRRRLEDQAVLVVQAAAAGARGWLSHGVSGERGFRRGGSTAGKNTEGGKSTASAHASYATSTMPQALCHKQMVTSHHAAW